MQVGKCSLAVQVGSEIKPTQNTAVFICSRCNMMYHDYRQLLEHLYWRHGTESRTCKQCGLKRWTNAAHMCNVLPIFIDLVDSGGEEEYCFCRRQVDAPLIGCDGPTCAIQWYHFTCVGIVNPPDGDWLCPGCNEINQQSFQDLKQT